MSSRMPPNNRERILVIKLGALGDFVQALGPMRAIRRHHPAAHITLLTTVPFEGMARQSGYVDDLLIDRRPKWHDIGGWIYLRRLLNAGHFTRVYDLQNNDRTGLYFKLFSPKPEWVGIAKGATHRNTSPDRSKGLAFYGHVQTLALAGIQDIQIDTLDWMTADLSRFHLPARYALIVPGSAPQHAEKRWPAVYYQSLCARLLADHITPVLIGTESEKEILDAIAAQPGVLHLGGQTKLTDIPALARGAALAVGNDTGPVHLIAPTGCPTLVLFSGKTKPHKHAPLGSSVHILQEHDLKDLDVARVAKAAVHIMH